jgi:hypothetical protein
VRRALKIIALLLWSVFAFALGVEAQKAVLGADGFNAGYVQGVKVCELRHRERP